MNGGQIAALISNSIPLSIISSTSLQIPSSVSCKSEGALFPATYASPSVYTCSVTSVAPHVAKSISVHLVYSTSGGDSIQLSSVPVQAYFVTNGSIAFAQGASNAAAFGSAFTTNVALAENNVNATLFTTSRVVGHSTLGYYLAASAVSQGRIATISYPCIHDSVFTWLLLNVGVGANVVYVNVSQNAGPVTCVG